MVVYKNVLYQNIVNNKNSVETIPVNAVVKDDYIIPGLYGKKVNLLKSFYKMKPFNTFNEHFLIIDYQKPEISLEDNKNKIIKNANPMKNQISFIVDNEEIKNYMIKNRIAGNILVDNDSFQEQSVLEQINNELENYNKLEKRMRNNHLQNQLCYYSSIIEKECIKHKKYLIEPTYYMDNHNLIEMKRSINPGNIYFIKQTVKLEDFIYFYNSIQYKGIKTVFLSELISEQID